MNVRSY